MPSVFCHRASFSLRGWDMEGGHVTPSGAQGRHGLVVCACVCLCA